ncbi:MAG: NusA-like transcription termination signal-binding factor [Nanoarchaeota archaeon]
MTITTKKIDMQFIRYMNLFSRVTKMSAKHCFNYNNMVVFVIPRFAIERAIGRNNENLKQLSEIIGKRIRVVAEPAGIKDLKDFVKIIVSPIEFEKIDVHDTDKGKEAVIATSGREAKAMLIGRARAREGELREILEQYFGIKNIRFS